MNLPLETDPRKSSFHSQEKLDYFVILARRIFRTALATHFFKLSGTRVSRGQLVFSLKVSELARGST